ncbi:hypothetical protein TNCV_992991 [Trichonephila clavipes]|nr:hypothetical protein TNCV_992991 [Trichonephila clavipes]
MEMKRSSKKADIIFVPIAISESSGLLPVPATQTRFERKERFDDVPDIQRNVVRLLNSIQNEYFLQSFRTCRADLRCPYLLEVTVPKGSKRQLQQAPNFLTKHTGGFKSSTDAVAHLHGGSLVELGLEPTTRLKKRRPRFDHSATSTTKGNEWQGDR